MKVCIFTIIPEGLYSGGRYLSLILAHSLRRAGADVTYVTNNLPLFDADFRLYEEAAPLNKIVSKDFSVPGDVRADWVVVIPTGSFNDRFYNAALDKAREWKARVALLSFETPNWFNRHSPYARSPMPTESWRQVVARGGAVITIAEEGIRPAQRFFGEDRADLHFDYWHPAINDLVAAQARPRPDGRKRITAFTRTQDPHKGAHDLLAIEPGLLSGHTLSLVFGRGIDEAYVGALARHFGEAEDFSIELHDRISDLEKFELLASSRLLLFPSYFEGYGYPPVEAGWMGVPTVAYDLPLLRETVADTARYAPLGDQAAFSGAIRQVLADPPDPAAVRAGMKVVPDTLTAGRKFLASLSRAERAVAPLATATASLKQPVAGNAPRDPAARALLGSVSGNLQIEGLEAALCGRDITIRGRLTGKKAARRLRFTMANAQIPDLRLGEKHWDVDEFEVTGHIDCWQTDEIRQKCQIDIVERGGTLTPKTALEVGVSPELLFERQSRFPNHGPGHSPLRPAGLLCVAGERLLGSAPLSLALSCVAQALFEDGIRSELFLAGGEPQISENCEPEFLPLVDRVASGDAGACLARIREVLAAGGLAVVDQAWLASRRGKLPGECAACECPVAGDGGGLVILSTRPAKAKQAAALRAAFGKQGVNAGRRAAVGRSYHSLLLLSSRHPVGQLPEALAGVLSGLQLRVPGLRVVLPSRLCAQTGLQDPFFGGVGRVSVLGETALIPALDAAGSVAGLILDGDSPDLLLDALLEARGAAAPVPLPQEGEPGQIVETLAQAMRRSSRSPLADLLDALVPGPRPDFRSPILDTFRDDTAPVAMPVPLPALSRENSLCFTAPRADALPGLLEGWASMDEHGAALKTQAGIVGFRIDRSEIRDHSMLEILLRAGGNKENRPFQIGLNGRTIGSARRLKPGVHSYTLDLDRTDWSEAEDQYLSIRRESDVDIALLAVALSDPAPAQLDWDATQPDADRLAPVRTAMPTDFRIGEGRLTRGLRLSSGWHAPEPGGCWTSGALAAIGFDGVIGGDGPIILSLEGTAFGAAGHDVQRIGIANGPARLADLVLKTGRVGRHEAVLPATLAREGFDTLFLECPDAISPAALGASGDMRALGFFASRLSVIHTGPAPDRRPLSDAERALAGQVLELKARPGVLRLTGTGPVAPGTRFWLAGTEGLAAPQPLPGGRWEASLRLSRERLDQEALTLLALRPVEAGVIAPLPAIDELELWPELTGDETPERGLRLTLGAALMPGDPRWGLPETGTAPPATSFDVQQPEQSAGVLGEGWSHPETAFVWSDCARAALKLPAGREGGVSLGLLRAGAFLPEGRPVQRQRVCLGADGPLVTLLNDQSEAALHAIPLPDPGPAPKVLSFEFPDALSPLEAGLNTDPRTLSMSLVGFRCASLKPCRGRLKTSWRRGPRGAARSLKCLGQRAEGIVLELSGAGDAPAGVVLDALRGAVFHPIAREDGWAVLVFCPAAEAGEHHRLLGVAPAPDSPLGFEPAREICDFTLRGAAI